MDNMTVTSRSPGETMAAAAELAKRLRPGDFVALYGDLGAGKTQFVKGLASVLCPGAEVTSPTFNLVHEYEGPVPLFHFDKYRIHSFDELYGIGFFEYPERGGVCVCEWSENIGFALPEDYYRVEIRNGETEGERLITIQHVLRR